jgi:hypothetical protein
LSLVRDVIGRWRQTVEMRQLPSDPDYAVDLWLAELRALFKSSGLTDRDLETILDDDPGAWLENEYALRAKERL